MRKFLIVAVACATLFVTALFAGPVSSGAWLLLLPTPARRVEHDLPPDYEPLHKGGEYENGGRLARVTSSDGSIRRYQYNDRHELTVIEEPGTSIENHFENGRCVRQINRFGDGSTPYVFDFRYEVKEERVVGTESRRSDGTWVRYRWNESGAAVSESLGHGEQEAFSLTYERDATSQVVTALTLTCPDRRGQPLRHTSIVSDGNEDAIERGLLETHCSWRRYTAARQAGPRRQKANSVKIAVVAREHSPMRIKLSSERRTSLLRATKEYFAVEFDEPLSDFRANGLLDFFIRELGPPIYNQGVRDASSYMQKKLADIEGEITEVEE